MNIKETDISPLEKHFHCVISKNEMDQQIDEKLSDIKKRVNYSGYRVGKAPTWILKKHYSDKIREQIMSDKITECRESITSKLDVALDEIDKDIHKDQNNSGDLSFLIKVALKPKIVLPDIKPITLKKPVVKDIKQHMDKSKEDLKKLHVKLGDDLPDSTEITKDHILKVKMSLTVKKTGYKIIEDKDFTVDLSDDGVPLIPKIREFVLGKKRSNENFEFEFHGGDEGLNLNIVKEDVVCHFKIQSVHEKIIPELDEKFVKELGHETVEKFEQNIEKRIKSEINDKIFLLMSVRLFNELDKIFECDIPEMLLEKEIKSVETAMKDEKLPGDTSESDNKAKDSSKKIAIRRIKIGFLIGQYAQEHKINVEQHEISKAMMDYIRTIEPSLQGKMISFYHQNPDAMRSVFAPKALERRVVNRILNNEITSSEYESNLEEIEQCLEKEVNHELYK